MYLDDEDLRKEYVQNDVGKVFQGSSRRYGGKEWILGQFDDSVLPACCFILQNSKLKPQERGNAVKVARAISAMVRLNHYYKTNMAVKIKELKFINYRTILFGTDRSIAMTIMAS